jgi:hypothetical protein
MRPTTGSRANPAVRNPKVRRLWWNGHLIAGVENSLCNVILILPVFPLACRCSPANTL